MQDTPESEPGFNNEKIEPVVSDDSVKPDAPSAKKVRCLKLKAAWHKFTPYLAKLDPRDRLKAIWAFVKTHKKKFIAGGVVGLSVLVEIGAEATGYINPEDREQFTQMLSGYLYMPIKMALGWWNPDEDLAECSADTFVGEL